MNRAVDQYHSLLQQMDAQRDHLRKGDSTWNVTRTVVFLAAAAMLLLGHFLVPHPVIAGIGWLLAVGFLAVVTAHENLRDKLKALRGRRTVLRRLIARNERNWDRLPLWNPDLDRLFPKLSPSEPNEAAEPSLRAGGYGNPAAVADDLDVFGRGSLFQLVSTASLGPGLRRLAVWLIGPARGDVAARRHQAVESLKPLRDWRIDFYTQARRAASGTAEPDRFLKWITSPSYLRRHPVLSLWSMAAPVVSILLVVLLIGGVTVVPAGDQTIRVLGGALAAVVLVNLLISTFLLGEVHDIFASALAGRGDINGYRELFALCERLPASNSGDESDLLSEVRRTLTDPEHGAGAAMHSLSRVAVAASLKHSGALFLIYLVLQMCGLWDLHVLRRLERWQAEHAADAPRWFDSLGDLEAAASLAAVADENPEWSSPQWVSGEDESDRMLKADQIGHPLLSDDVRVCNDVEVGPSGTLLLVTGSNMSGKSTLLRSIGLNVLLAGAGGPVCARRLSLPDIELATSIRVRDDLDEGVSFYMAELKSLAQVVRHAEALAAARREASQDRPPAMLLYLLDEILQGTNSRERQIAVAHVLKYLMDHGAIGAISTHDLELADDPQLQSVAHTVHFRETIERDETGGDRMTFDYRMRQGVSPTTNALKLLELVGLGKPEAVRT